MLDDVIEEIFLPPYVRNQIIDRLVDTLANISPDSRWGKLMRSFHSDAEFHAAFEHALKHAVERFVAEYSDKELASALVHSTHFWDLPQVQNALREIIRRPSSYLETERNTLFTSFTDVLPAVEPDF
jgi:hypothetical protein